MAGKVLVEHDGDITVVIIDNPPISTSSHEIRKGLLAAIGEIENDSSIVGAVLIGAGRSFISGSDIREFDLPLEAPQMPQVIAAIEGGSKPYVAALHGAALGGGYELALGCDSRIAAPGTVVGLPECALGIIPGADGTQKLPRLVGRAEAIRLIAGAALVRADKALTLGLIDAVEAGDLRKAASKKARMMAGTKQRVIDRPVLDNDEAEGAAAKALRGARPHVQAVIRHIMQAGTSHAREELDAERESFQQLRTTPEATALRHVFFAERKAAGCKPGRESRPEKVDLFGVIGSGTMGAGIATAILQAGKRVILIDANAGALAKGVARIEEAIDGAVSRGWTSSPSASAAKDSLNAQTDLAALAPCDLVIEAAFEDQVVKDELFGTLGSILRPEAIHATNTSYLDIDRMARNAPRPDHVIGLHFFSPAHKMKLLEIVRGSVSSDVAMATGLAVARIFGKQPVEAANSFGFIGNRIYAAYRAACEFMLEDGALPHEVDSALEVFGFAMGPFAVADLSGLDIARNMRRQKAADRDLADRYVYIPDRLCDAGRFGRKTGTGYYRYGEDGKRTRDPEVEALIIAASEEKGIMRHTLDLENIQRRALAAIVSEAACIVAEGVALRPADIDVVLVNGYGFPRWIGGPVHWARQQNAKALAADCGRFAEESGPSRKKGDLRLLGVDIGGNE